MTREDADQIVGASLEALRAVKDVQQVRVKTLGAIVQLETRKAIASITRDDTAALAMLREGVSRALEDLERGDQVFPEHEEIVTALHLVDEQRG